MVFDKAATPIASVCVFLGDTAYKSSRFRRAFSDRGASVNASSSRTNDGIGCSSINRCSGTCARRMLLPGIDEASLDVPTVLVGNLIVLTEGPGARLRRSKRPPSVFNAP